MNGATGAAGGGAGTGSPLPEARDGRPPQPHHPPQAYAPPPQAALPGPQPGQQPPGYGPPTTAGGTAQGARRQPRPAARTAAPHTRKARLRVSKADPWSVMKVSFLLSIALGVCTVVAVAVLWMVLDALGVFATVGSTISDATGSGTGGGFDLQGFLSLPRVVMFTSVIAVIDVVLATALATLASFLYNMSAGFVGGIELTLAEDE